MRGNEPKRWNVDTVVLVGDLWIFCVTMLGFFVPFAIIGLLFLTDTYVAVADALDFWIFPIVLVTAFVFSWLGWSSQISAWRVWAYRRVEDVAALKESATGTLIWPDGHLFERTEFRSRDQAAELARLEGEAQQRAASRAEAGQVWKEPTSVVGTLAKAIMWGLALGVPIPFAPVGLLQLLGVYVADRPIVWGGILALAVGLSITISATAFRHGLSADEALRRVLPSWALRKDVER